MKGFSFELEAPYFSTFRVPTSTSLILTYSIPPFTTIRGLISNALGLPRDDLTIQDKVKLGIMPLKLGEKNVEMAKILKLKEQPGKRSANYPSSPLFRQFLFNPKFRVYVGGEDKDIIEIYNALIEPKRFLYLGQSDELVDIKISDYYCIKETVTTKLDSCTAGILPDAQVEKLPYKFNFDGKGYSLDYIILSIFKRYPVQLQSQVSCYDFHGLNISLV